MSINWVMTSPAEATFVKLPNEKILYISPPRTSLSLSSTNSFPGTQPWSVNSSDGIVYITNQRIVYIPTTLSPELQNFSAPILNLEDSYVRVPFWGANYWGASVRPVPGGGIPSNHSVVELKFTFKEGGAFDYHTIYEQIKERLHHALSLARDSGHGIGSVGILGAAELASVNLEQLPAYEPARGAPATSVGVADAREQNVRDADVAGIEPPNTQKEEQTFTAPNEPPPGYEEVQAQALDISQDQ